MAALDSKAQAAVGREIPGENSFGKTPLPVEYDTVIRSTCVHNFKLLSCEQLKELLVIKTVRESLHP